jgi:hypothetical protein
MKKMLIQRVHESKTTGMKDINGKPIKVSYPVGVFIGMNDKGCIRVGWSRCRLAPAPIPKEIFKLLRPEVIAKHAEKVKNSDEFDLEHGINQACRNILECKTAPHGRGFNKKFQKFEKRCISYFKDATCIQKDNDIMGVSHPKSAKSVKKPVKVSKSKVNKAKTFA